MPSSVKTCWIKVQLDTTWIGSKRATPPTDTCFIVKLNRPCKGDKESQLTASYLGKTHRLSLIAQLIKNLPTKKKKNLPTMQETPVQFLSQEDPLEKGQATHSNILIWRNPWTVLFMRSQRVGHDWVTFTFTLGKMHVWNISCDYLKTLWKSEPIQPLSLNKEVPPVLVQSGKSQKCKSSNNGVYLHTTTFLVAQLCI